MQENAVVINSIIGWKSSIGRWSRVQASGDYNDRLGITILGNFIVFFLFNKFFVIFFLINLFLQVRL
jgi:hypothetical protein